MRHGHKHENENENEADGSSPSAPWLAPPALANGGVESNVGGGGRGGGAGGGGPFDTTRFAVRPAAVELDAPWSGIPPVNYRSLPSPDVLELGSCAVFLLWVMVVYQVDLTRQTVSDLWLLLLGMVFPLGIQLGMTFLSGHASPASWAICNFRGSTGQVTRGVGSPRTTAAAGHEGHGGRLGKYMRGLGTGAYTESFLLDLVASFFSRSVAVASSLRNKRTLLEKQLHHTRRTFRGCP